MIRKAPDDVHRQAALIPDAMPLSYVLLDKEYHCIDCNEAAIKLFKIKDKQKFLKQYLSVSPEYQPDGHLSPERVAEYVNIAFESGSYTADWIFQSFENDLIPAEVMLIRIDSDDDSYVAGFIRDLRAQTKMLKDVEQRDMLFSTVNEAISLLLEAETVEFESALWTCMGIMANAVDADRMRLWENHEIDGNLCCTQLYEWSEGVEPQQGTAITINTSYKDDLPGWEETLSSGQCINSIVHDLPTKIFNRLSSQGIMSVLIVPVFLRNEFWGFVGFNDCHKERLFTTNEESILRTASLLIANALLRNEMTQELAAALEESRAASKAKSQFLSNMSHEIRTPINAIVGMTMIGKSAPDSEKKDYAFEKIEVASSHLLGVINDVLDMSKIEANKLELSNVEFNFEQMLQKVVNVIIFNINDKSQKFTMSFDPDIPQRMVGDDQRLAQVITNLLSNAVKFTPEVGVISLGLRFLGEEDGLNSIEIKVSDTGVGISAEQLQRLFAPFEQAESSISRKFGGTGLGLYLSKQIVELMGGEIKADSTHGKGSAFTVTVKLGCASEHSGTPSPPELPEGIRVLVVDDEQEMLEYFAEIAKRIGISCDYAINSHEALALLNENSYSICFIDWKMPDMDGIELSRVISAGDKEKPIIIIISAYDWISAEADVKTAGIDGFLSKPLFPSDVADCISKHMFANDEPESEETEQSHVDSFEGYRILLAEDMEINREIVLGLLEFTQLQIDCAVNGIEAVQIFGASPEIYDMIFMDMQMPEMDGLTATRRIRELTVAKAKEIPIVAMTANVFREDIEQCLQAGMNDHIGKPVDQEEILKKLRRYLPPHP